MAKSRGRLVLKGIGAWWVVIGALASACSARSSLIAGDGEGSAGGSAADLCQQRTGTVSCRAEPPPCGPDEFPASDGVCWTGECLDCVDGCQSDDDCVVVQACGCAYHEGCSFAETRYRAERLDSCVRYGDGLCTSDCAATVCSSFDCPWCSADGATCDNGRCVAVVSHQCY